MTRRHARLYGGRPHEPAFQSAVVPVSRNSLGTTEYHGTSFQHIVRWLPETHRSRDNTFQKFRTHADSISAVHSELFEPVDRVDLCTEYISNLPNLLWVSIQAMTRPGELSCKNSCPKR